MEQLHPDPPCTFLGRGRNSLGLAVAALAMVGLAVEVVAPVTAAEDTLQESQSSLRQFPFAPNCAGNSQEMVACLWQRRNRADATLQTLLGRSGRLEEWRASRRHVCEIAAEKARGGSVHPIVWLSCENGLNNELLRQIRRPLLQSADL